MEEKTQDKHKEPIEGEPGALKGAPAVEPVEKKPLAPEKEKITEKKPEAEPEKKIEEVLEEEKAGSAPVPPSDKIKDKIKELQGLDQENQVKTLFDLTFQESPDFAIEVAKGLSPYIQDELHKKLTEDKSYKALVDKEKLKKL